MNVVGLLGASLRLVVSNLQVRTHRLTHLLKFFSRLLHIHLLARLFIDVVLVNPLHERLSKAKFLIRGEDQELRDPSCVLFALDLFVGGGVADQFVGRGVVFEFSNDFVEQKVIPRILLLDEGRTLNVKEKHSLQRSIHFLCKFFVFDSNFEQLVVPVLVLDPVELVDFLPNWLEPLQILANPTLEFAIVNSEVGPEVVCKSSFNVVALRQLLGVPDL